MSMTPPLGRFDATSRTGSPIPRPSSCASGSYGSPRVGDGIRNSPKPHSSPKMKLRWFDSCLCVGFFDLLFDVIVVAAVVLLYVWFRYVVDFVLWFHLICEIFVALRSAADSMHWRESRPCQAWRHHWTTAAKVFDRKMKTNAVWNRSHNLVRVLVHCLWIKDHMWITSTCRILDRNFIWSNGNIQTIRRPSAGAYFLPFSSSVFPFFVQFSLINSNRQ